MVDCFGGKMFLKFLATSNKIKFKKRLENFEPWSTLLLFYMYLTIFKKPYSLFSRLIYNIQKI
jgi:hypothetical protein